MRRRDMLARAQWAVLPALLPCPLHARETAVFEPPAVLQRFTRRLVRQLGESDRGVFTRSYLIRFDAAPGGFEVTGEQTSVEVVVPPALERLAELERARTDSGPFPLMLDQGGYIAADNAPTALSDEAKQAVAMAIGMLGQRQGNDDAGAFLRNLSQGGQAILSPLPRGLFVPGDTDVTEKREIVSGDGVPGSIAMHIRSRCASPAGLLRSLERTIVTEAGGSRRETSETFMLEAAI